jgi:hypothetical protein
MKDVPLLLRAFGYYDGTLAWLADYGMTFANGASRAVAVHAPVYDAN